MICRTTVTGKVISAKVLGDVASMRGRREDRERMEEEERDGVEKKDIERW